jgi:hypothetical protein
MSDEIVPLEQIQARIRVMRGHRVLLDRDLALFYGVSTKVLNQAVKRNEDRFPVDFRFLLIHEEVANLKSQIVTSSDGHGGVRKLPSAFTEHGILMAATVLNSPRAVQMSKTARPAVAPYLLAATPFFKLPKLAFIRVHSRLN